MARYDVFISHPGRVNTTARVVKSLLQDWGLRCFLALDESPGIADVDAPRSELVDEFLARSVRESRVLLLLWAHTRNLGWIQHEVDRSSGKPAVFFGVNSLGARTEPPQNSPLRRLFEEFVVNRLFKGHICRTLDVPKLGKSLCAVGLKPKWVEVASQGPPAAHALDWLGSHGILAFPTGMDTPEHAAALKLTLMEGKSPPLGANAHILVDAEGSVLDFSSLEQAVKLHFAGSKGPGLGSSCVPPQASLLVGLAVALLFAYWVFPLLTTDYFIKEATSTGGCQVRLHPLRSLFSCTSGIVGPRRCDGGGSLPLKEGRVLLPVSSQCVVLSAACDLSREWRVTCKQESPLD